jgi:hypothetical protein
MKSRKTTKRNMRKAKGKKPGARIAPQRLVDGDDFRVNKKQGRRVDISPTGMARIIEEWLKGRASILVVDGREIVKIRAESRSV